MSILLQYEKRIENVALALVQLEHQMLFNNDNEYNEFIMDHFYLENISHIDRAKILYKIYMLCHYYRSYK